MDQVASPRNPYPEKVATLKPSERVLTREGKGVIFKMVSRGG